MATVIRLARFGKRHNPIYRAVVIDSRKARDDSFIEQVGFYNPNTKAPEIKFEQEKVLKWLQVGAQPQGVGQLDGVAPGAVEPGLGEGDDLASGGWRLVVLEHGYNGPRRMPRTVESG